MRNQTPELSGREHGEMNMRKTIGTTILASFLGLAALAPAAGSTPLAGKWLARQIGASEGMETFDEALACGAGAAIGGVFGGPLGAVVGAAAGAL
jgi:hypothetical protein